MGSMTERGSITTEIRLRPARVQRAAESQVEAMIATLNRVMDLSDEERERMAEAIRALAHR